MSEPTHTHEPHGHSAGPHPARDEQQAPDAGSRGGPGSDQAGDDRAPEHGHTGDHTHHRAGDHAEGDSHEHGDHDHPHTPGGHEHHGEQGHGHGDPHDHHRHGHEHDRHEHDHHGHGDEHGHSHGDGHGHPHEHEGAPAGGGWRRIRHQLGHLVTPHSHEAMDKVDAAAAASREGMRTLWLSLGILGATTVIQAVIVALSGSVALLGDTIHNAADALTAVPLGVAFVLGRRAANRRYTYGYGRGEDLAGVAIVLTIAASSALAAYTAVERLAHPREITDLWAVAVAAAVGFLGNEWVARYRIGTGRRIGSAALIADGMHARTDGFTSLAVLIGAGGAALGWPLADPIVGLVITVAILMVLKDAAREVYRRLMDSVDPRLVEKAEAALRDLDGVRGLGQVRMRWIGHELRAEASIVVDPELTVVQAHEVAVGAEHALIHAVPRLTAATVHTDHLPQTGNPHAVLAHHRAAA